jgi:hypothetical protein
MPKTSQFSLRILGDNNEPLGRPISNIFGTFSLYVAYKETALNVTCRVYLIPLFKRCPVSISPPTSEPTAIVFLILL